MSPDIDPANAYLDLAARLALRATGDVEPNPVVGCVLVRDGEIVGMGHHKRFGGLHAEREAIADCLARGNSPRGATAYVTLEPCRHHGKQPPCTDALIDAGIARVVYATPDPGPESGGGAAVLREAGIECELSDASTFARRITMPFVHRVRTGRPWVVAKWAQTIDGRIATRTGESQWISNEHSRRRVHRRRAVADAVITGLGTVMIDNPMLNARGVARVRRNAIRVIVDTDLDTPTQAQVARTAREIPTILACSHGLINAKITADRRRKLEEQGVQLLRVHDIGGRRLDLAHMLKLLHDDHGVSTAFVEAGPMLLGSFFDEDLVDEAVVYVAPLLLGDEMARSVASGRVAPTLTTGRAFALDRLRRCGDDVELTYSRLRQPHES